MAPAVEIENRISAALPVPALDKDQFRQVFINLIQNATEAIPKDRSGLVTVSAAGGTGGPWRIVVADNGDGIAEDALEEIFQPLFTTKTKGTGLGLAVVAGMVERHDGRIWAESKEDEGTQFIIELQQPDPSTRPSADAPSAAEAGES